MKPIEAKILSPLLGDKIELPNYATSGSAAMDLRACIEKPITIPSGGRHLFPSGIAFNMQDSNMMGMIGSRSGLALKYALRAHPGVIDSDYHGELGILLHNDGPNEYTVEPGDRIAQIVFFPIIRAELNVVEEFSIETDRGTGGFGSTGTK